MTFQSWVGRGLGGRSVSFSSRPSDHTDLACAPDELREEGNVQHDLGIEMEASYALTVKNPEEASPPGTGLEASARVELPRELQKRFRGRRFVPAEPPRVLDFRGTGVLLVGAREDVRQESGLDLEAEAERSDSENVFRELRLDRSETPTEPLFKGQWR